MSKYSDLQVAVLHSFIKRKLASRWTIGAELAYRGGTIGVKVSQFDASGEHQELFYSLRSIMDPINGHLNRTRLVVGSKRA